MTGAKNPRAIIEWRNGLDEPPIIRAMGRSAEESEMILSFLERLLKNKPFTELAFDSQPQPDDEPTEANAPITKG